MRGESYSIKAGASFFQVPAMYALLPVAVEEPTLQDMAAELQQHDVQCQKSFPAPTPLGTVLYSRHNRLWGCCDACCYRHPCPLCCCQHSCLCWHPSRCTGSGGRVVFPIAGTHCMLSAALIMGTWNL